MPSGVISALIAASISAIGVAVSLIAQRAHERQWNNDRTRAMTQRLYEERLTAYPIAMRLTEPLRRGRLRGFDGSTRSLLDETRQALDDWQSGSAAFIISKRTLQCVYGLRDALGLEPENEDHFTGAEIDRLFKAKNALRYSLRSDMRFLYDEDSEDESSTEI